MKPLSLAVNLLVFLLTVTAVSGQQYSYRNEVRGFELFQNGSWKTLVPYVSTKEDVEKVFGQSCEKACDYDGNWRLVVMYVGPVWGYSQKYQKGVQCVEEKMFGKYSSLIFYPKRRITRDKFRFGKQFDKGMGGDSHGVPSVSHYYADSLGLIYQFSAENTYDKRYRKGDLVSIQYTSSVEDYEKHGRPLECL